nr:ACT domain-containing protein [Burkholderia multivorans]
MPVSCPIDFPPRGNSVSQPVSDLAELLASMRPELNEGAYVFSSVQPDRDVSRLAPLATFRESEGLTVIVDEATALREDLPVLFRAAWITLTVHSDLQAVGLTAAVAEALTRARISCNVVAAAFHDHIFVPVERATEALAQLADLQARAAQGVAG